MASLTPVKSGINTVRLPLGKTGICSELTLGPQKLHYFNPQTKKNRAKSSGFVPLDFPLFVPNFKWLSGLPYLHYKRLSGLPYLHYKRLSGLLYAYFKRLSGIPHAHFGRVRGLPYAHFKRLFGHPHAGYEGTYGLCPAAPLKKL